MSSKPTGRILAHTCPTRPIPRELMELTCGWGAGAVIVAAHPDDETIGAGGVLPHLPLLAMVHVTDGAPKDRRWWGDPAAASRDEYAAVRQSELASALALAGVAAGRVHTLGRQDQRASADLAALASDVARLLDELQPGVVLTHAYEGGHPDHDATAFAVHAARERMVGARPVVVELTSYHASGDGIASGRFIPSAAKDVGVALTAEDLERKRAMLACFATQRETLAQFADADAERFRIAPEYDFTAPPHAGTLHYERYDWGVTGREWRQRAAEALEALGIGVAVRC
jgi:LmbE family N-acetylglucosaminyl deacetylase